MKIEKGLPPNIDKIRMVLSPQKNTVFAYGDTIYAQDNEYISPDLIVHEGIHQLQQGDDPDAWWNRYLYDPAFRLSQEVDAYRAQYHFIKKTLGGSHMPFLANLAKDLSSEMYGKLLTFGEAVRMIRIIPSRPLDKNNVV